MIIRSFMVIFCSLIMTFSASAEMTRIVVAGGGGNTIDLLARIMVIYLSEQTGRIITIENRPGSNGAVAFNYVANSPPDGNIILMTDTGYMPLNPKVTLKPIAPIAFIPIYLTVSAKYGTMDEFLLTAKNGKMNYGILGPGTTSDLCNKAMALKYNFKAQAIPFRTNPEIITQMLGDRIDFTCTSKAAVEGLPLKQFDRGGSLLFALFAPINTPDSIVQEWNDALYVLDHNPKYSEEIKTKMDAQLK